jgi:hypothetical protein
VPIDPISKELAGFNLNKKKLSLVHRFNSKQRATRDKSIEPTAINSSRKGDESPVRIDASDERLAKARASMSSAG